MVHYKQFFFMAAACFGMLWLTPSAAQAQPLAGVQMLAVMAAGGENATCTNEFQQGDNQGLLTQIIDYIKEVIDQATMELYNGIIYHPSFLMALNAAFTLFVTLFGALFIFGIVPLTLGQASMRLFKIAIILALVNEGFPFFKEYAIKFFNDGTDELINAILGIATGDKTGVSYSDTGSPQPFRKIEPVVQKILSSKMMTTLIGSFTTGPMGPAMGGLIGFSIYAFVMSIVKALRIYCLSLVAKALLFGMAPIFMSFMMFERTKHMFSGWYNQLVNYSLQPILMFAFISFFVVLMESAADNILKADLCWTEFDHMEGSPSAASMWRFKDGNNQQSASDFTWKGMVSCLEKGGKCDDFPVSVIDILTFFILAHLAYKFSDVVMMIATEIASSTLDLSKAGGGGIAQMLKEGGAGKGSRPDPGGGKN